MATLRTAAPPPRRRRIGRDAGLEILGGRLYVPAMSRCKIVRHFFFFHTRVHQKTKYNTECLLTPRAKQAKFAELYVMRMSSEFRRVLELCSSCLILVFV